MSLAQFLVCLSVALRHLSNQDDSHLHSFFFGQGLIFFKMTEKNEVNLVIMSENTDTQTSGYCYGRC